MISKRSVIKNITRPKKVCVQIGQAEALSYAMWNQTVNKHNFLLKERLSGIVGEEKQLLRTATSKPYEFMISDSRKINNIR